jgi:hypothetical protein
MTMGDRIHPRRARMADGAVNSAVRPPAAAEPDGRAGASVAPREQQVEKPDRLAALPPDSPARG